jgi:prophage regulatory protein
MSVRKNPASILRLKDLQQRVPLSRSTLYAKIAAGEFPAPITLGPRAVGWLSSDIDKWIQSRGLKPVQR